MRELPQCPDCVDSRVTITPESDNINGWLTCHIECNECGFEWVIEDCHTYEILRWHLDVALEETKHAWTNITKMTDFIERHSLEPLSKLSEASTLLAQACDGIFEVLYGEEEETI